MNLASKAHQLFKRREYNQAKEIYKDLNLRLGSNAFLFNIQQCEKAIREIEASQHPQITTAPDSTGNSQETVIPGQKISRSWKVEPKSIYKFTADLIFESHEKEKQCIALIEYHDKDGKAIKSLKKEEVNMPWSPVYNQFFFYIGGGARTSKFTQTIKAPHNTSLITLTILAFKLKEGESLKINNITFKPQSKKITLASYISDKNLSLNPRSLKVALVCDEFTYNSFKHEFAPVPVTPSDWEARFSEQKPDIFFCESTWSGIDSTSRPWQGKVYASSSFKKENRIELLKIIAYCKKNSIPTIFWNKEDPTHYSDRFTDFVRTAQEFDFVFTTAEECVARYKHDIRHSNVFSMPFASNPHIFNPIKRNPRSNDVVFAGSWYKTLHERCADTTRIFDSIIDSGLSLKVYDRYYDSQDTNRKWPYKYQPFIYPSEPQQRMPDVYKESRYALNINTVKTSESMFARRVFELMTSNTLVLSNSSFGMDKLLPDLFLNIDNGIEILTEQTPEEINIIRRRALTHVLAKHTYTHRWNSLLRKIGCNVASFSNRFTFCVVVTELDQVQSVLNWNASHGDSIIDPDLCIVAGKGFHDEDLQELYFRYNNGICTVTSYAHLKKYAVDTYNPIDTDFFAMTNYSNLDESIHSLDSVHHLQYIKDALIHPAPSHACRYTFGPLIESPYLLAGTTNQFKEALVALEDHKAIAEVYYA